MERGSSRAEQAKPKRRTRRKSSASYGVAPEGGAAQLPEDFLLHSPAADHAAPAHALGRAAAATAASASATTAASAAAGSAGSANASGGLSKAPGLRIPPHLDGAAGANGLAPFAAYGTGSLAPFWLSSGVCEQWGLNLFSTELRLAAVSENATFAVVERGRPTAVVRVSQPGYVGGAVAVASEIAWVDALRNLPGVRVVRNIPTASGFPVATIRDEGGRAWTCVCMSFAPGSAMDALPDPRPYFRAIGAAAARLHTHARSWTPPEGFKRFTWGIDDMVGEFPRWGRWQDHVSDPSRVKALEQAGAAAVATLSACPRTPQNWGLVHGDLRPGNLIVGPDGDFTIIDFDDCGYSWYVYDFACALSFLEHEPIAPQLAKLWVEGYQSVAALTDDDLACACALSMLRRLQLLGWAAGHYPDALPTHLRNTLESGAELCAERYLRNPLWLLE